jgi:anti-anti-sigma factor
VSPPGFQAEYFERLGEIHDRGDDGMREQPGTAVSVREVGEGASILDVRGELSAVSENALLDAYSAAAREGIKAIILNAASLERLDGSGLTLLVRLSAWASEAGQRLGVYGLGERCLRLFRELGLDSVMDFYPSAAAALQALGITSDSSHLEGTPGAQTLAGETCPAENWTGPLGRAHIGPVPQGALNLNVAGRKIRSPMNGFGQLWHKTYRMRLSGVSAEPRQVVDLCKERLSDFWPSRNRLTLPPPGIVPGAVGFIKLRLPGGVPLATGIRVLHVAETSFTFVTLSGHMEAGWITFGAYTEEGTTVVQVESLARTGDPLYEIGFVLLGHGEQEKFWRSTLEALAKHYHVPARVKVLKSCLDPARRWGEADNIVNNAAARTGLHLAATLVGKMLRPRNR